MSVSELSVQQMPQLYRHAMVRGHQFVSVAYQHERLMPGTSPVRTFGTDKGTYLACLPGLTCGPAGANS